jgi:hypothetical protein
MMRMKAMLLLAAGSLLVLPAHRAAQAYNYWLYGGIPVIWPAYGSVRYLSPSTFPPGSQTESLILGAMGLWTIVPSADFIFQAITLPQDEPIDHFDGYNDTIAVDPSELDPGVLGVTFQVNNGPDWFDMDIFFSADAAGLGWEFSESPPCDVVGDPDTHGISFLLVAVHELGHAIGLAHDPIGDETPGTPFFVATMNPRYPSGGPIGDEAIVELHADDRNAVRALYPNSGPSNPETDLANSGYTWGSTVGKAIPAFFTPETVYPGDTVTLRCMVENFGNTNVFNVRQGFYLSEDPVVDPNDPTELLLGDLRWDIALGDGFDFDVDATLPADMAAGTYYLGSVLDDLDEVAEIYEDNNGHTYCTPLTVAQRVPEILALSQEYASCGTSYTGPTPAVTLPVNMGPITWSLDSPPAGMTINPVTGVIYWANPVRSPFLYTLTLRATNGAGSATTTLFLGVDQGLPTPVLPAARVIPHTQPYVGPTPVLFDPPCMNPILNWSLDDGPDGMEIDHSTGVVSWDRPRYSPFPYVVNVRATNAIGNGFATMALTVTGIPGDMNCDGSIDFDDITPFVIALGPEGPYLALYPDCEPRLADCDLDGDVDFDDITPFVQLIGSRGRDE